MNIRNLLILFLGVGLIFFSVFIFTQPAKFQFWDFSNTGQIGDTIGGITAPIINLIGAFLVYISFNEQVTANRLQIRALDDEKQDRINKEMYNRYYSLLTEIKVKLNELEFVIKIDNENLIGEQPSQSFYHVFKGLNALNESILRLESANKPNQNFSPYIKERYNSYSIILNFQFILSSILEFIELVEKKVDIKEDKDFLIKNIETFYNIYLSDFGDRIISALSFENLKVKDLKNVKQRIDNKFSTQ